MILLLAADAAVDCHGQQPLLIGMLIESRSTAKEGK